MYLIYLYRVIHFYITLRRLGWLGLGWDHVSFGGGVDRCIDRYLYRLSIDISVAMSVEGRPIIGRVPVEYRSRACRASTDMLATLGR